jgi:MOSC domain-containing protein YiiM
MLLTLGPRNGSYRAGVLPAVEGRVLSVNAGAPRELEWLGRRVTTAIWKHPVEGRVAVRGINVSGDGQADRAVHGGHDKALYGYAREDAEWWEGEVGRPIDPGGFGENLTLAGVDVNGAVIGEVWGIGTTLLEVSQPRIPCFKLGLRFDDVTFPRRFARGGRPGAYLRITREGYLGAGDPVLVVHRPDHGLTVRDVAVIYHREHDRIAELVEIPELAESWRAWASKRTGEVSRARLAG